MYMNHVYFSKEQVTAGEMNKFLNLLFEQCYGEGNDYNDIHIYPEDLGAFTVEWEQVPWSHEYGGRFVFKDFEELYLDEFKADDESDTCADEDIERDTDEFLKTCDCDFIKDCTNCGNCSSCSGCDDEIHLTDNFKPVSEKQIYTEEISEECKTCIYLGDRQNIQYLPDCICDDCAFCAADSED